MDEIKYGKKKRKDLNAAGAAPCSPGDSASSSRGIPLTHSQLFKGLATPSTTSSMLAERLQEMAESGQYEPEYEVERISSEIDKHSMNMKRVIMGDILAMKRRMAERHRKENEESLAENMKEVYIREEVNIKLKEKIARMKATHRRGHIQLHRLAYAHAEKSNALKAHQDQRAAFGIWLNFHREKVRERNNEKIASAHRQKRLLRNCLVGWRNTVHLAKRKQVDMYWRIRLE